MAFNNGSDKLIPAEGHKITLVNDELVNISIEKQ